MLTVLSAGLPISAKELLKNAMDMVFGDTVEMQELTTENLRSRVRLSNRSIETVLVILDSVSSEICADIENGLYRSDKYFAYTTDKKLAEFLNAKYDLDIVVEEVEEIVETEVDEVEEKVDREEIERIYQEKLEYKDKAIQNLERQLKEISEFYGIEGKVGVSSEELDELKDENIRLNNDLLDCRAEIDRLKGIEGVVETSKAEKSELENRIKKLSKNYDEVLHELNELKVAYSTQSGVIRDKEAKISELEKEITKLQSLKEDIHELEESIQSYRNMVVEKDAEIDDLRVDLQSKDREVTRYCAELDSLRGLSGLSEKLDSANSTISELRSELSDIVAEKDKLSKELKERGRQLIKLEEEINESSLKIEELDLENQELSERVKSDNESLIILNNEKLELQSKLSVLSKATASDDNVDELIREVQDLEERLATANRNVFTRIGTSALPNGSSGVRLISGQWYNNIRFVFAGGTESRKGTYKCLMEEFRSSRGDTRFLLVDLVTETFVDYVFEMDKIVPGIDWFRKGGSVQKYISDTRLKNTKVLSAGMGYINDSYFLCIDWAKRLKELDSSGYNVVVFCGDVSNIVGRVLHGSFADCGESCIYVSGSSTGSRTMVTNLRGLGNASSSKVAYFDFNASVAKKFYNMVNKTNECRVISTRGSARR